MKALTVSWPACPACGNRAKHDPLTRREFARLATGVPGRIPSEGVWCDVLLWLQKDPDTNAKDLLAKLCTAHPGRFSDTQLRTLQRRGKDWRGVMAKRLVYAASDEPAVEQRYRGESALVGTGISG